MLLFKPTNALRWFITVWSFGLFYQGKCIIPWSCVKIFSKSHLKTQYHLKLANSKSSSQSIPNGLHQQGSLKNLLPPHFKRGFYISHISRCPPQNRVLLVVFIWMMFTEVSPKVVSGVFTSIWWGKDKYRTLGEKRLQKTLFWEL